MTQDDFLISIGPEVICLHLKYFYIDLWAYEQVFTCKVIFFALNNVGSMDGSRIFKTVIIYRKIVIFKFFSLVSTDNSLKT